jgi:DNA-binding MarR family transcriptional regulator
MEDAMVDKLQHLLTKRPGDEDTIRGLVEVSPEFRDLLAKHHDVSERLHAMPEANPETRSDDRDALERERKHLEEQMHLLMENHQRI